MSAMTHVEELAEKLVAALGPDLEAIILFGSVARGQANSESDVDILIVTEARRKIRERVIEISYDLDLHHGTATSITYLTADAFKQRVSHGAPFITEVLKDGIALYDTGIFEQNRKASVGTGQ